MAVSIDATVGGASANSFATLAEFTTYMEGRLNSSKFDDASPDDKNRALVEATRDVDVQDYLGHRVTDTQALDWPRQWARDPDSPIQDYYTTTVVPQRVKDAVMELAFQFLKAETTDIAMPEKTDGVLEKKIDVLNTKYADPWARRRGLRRYPRVFDQLAPLLAVRATEVIRG